jgi:hypothetical protein
LITRSVVDLPPSLALLLQGKVRTVVERNSTFTSSVDVCSPSTPPLASSPTPTMTKPVGMLHPPPFEGPLPSFSGWTLCRRYPVAWPSWTFRRLPQCCGFITLLAAGQFVAVCWAHFMVCSMLTPFAQ